MASQTDIKVASLAAGFTLGFGFLTVWEAIKQTRRNRNPLRSTYIYMMWGEIVANLVIGIIGWLFLDGTLGPTVPVLFFILFLWVFEIQLLMQIIINRIAVIAENQKTIQWMKWGTAVIITMINIAVFCIWIPAHTVPPVSQTYVEINKYWDRISKVLILIVDAGLNWFFIRTVKTRLLQQHGLAKYKPLVGFNSMLMILSIVMDVMLIGLMSLPNQVVYVQFHPVAYMVKLNIEMSMASLITRLAKNQDAEFRLNSLTYSQDQHTHTGRNRGKKDQGIDPKGPHKASVQAMQLDKESEAMRDDTPGIHKRFDVNVTVERPGSLSTNDGQGDEGQSTNNFQRVGDEVPLTTNAWSPTTKKR